MTSTTPLKPQPDREATATATGYRAKSKMAFGEDKLRWELCLDQTSGQLYSVRRLAEDPRRSQH